MSRRILLVDDDPAVLRGVSGLLQDEGYRTETAATAAQAHEVLSRDPPAAVILDLGLPGESGLSLLARLPRPLPAPVVVLSGGATPGEAAQALKLGATDFVEKPPSAERLLTALANALALRDLEDERERLREELAQPGNLVGESAALVELRKVIARVAPTDSLILVEGETGTGKERVASRASCSAPRRAPSPAPRRGASGVSSRRRRERCSSTRSASCRSICRRSSSACSRNARSRGSAAELRSPSTCASSPPPIEISAGPSRRAASDRISTTGSRCFPSGSRRSGSVPATWSRSCAPSSRTFADRKRS